MNYCYLVVKAQFAGHDKSNKANTAKETVPFVFPLQASSLKEPRRLRYAVKCVEKARGHSKSPKPAVEGQKVPSGGLVQVNRRKTEAYNYRCGELKTSMYNDQPLALPRALSLKAHGHSVERRRINARRGGHHGNWVPAEEARRGTKTSILYAQKRRVIIV